MRVVVDVREHAFIEIIQSKISQYPFIVTLEIAQLAIGDMEIHMDGELKFVWERKTFQDLLASIKDGRYSEQSHRLLHTYGPSKVVYLIEGILSQLSPGEKKLAISTMTSLSLKKNFHLWRTVHVQDSVDSFLTVCEKLYNDKDKDKEEDAIIVGGGDTFSYTGMVKKIKKENITRENIGEIFLCQIPDISTTSAKVLMHHVDGDFSALCEIVRDRPDELKELRIGGDKPRKISKKVFERLAEFLK